MRSLPELQHALAIAVLGREPDVPWGIAAHRNNAFGNWAGALAGAYPIVRKIVGTGFFAALAREYAREYPSTSGDLREYGAHLPSFAAAFPQTQDLPYLPGVARMEWLAHLAHFAPDALPFDVALLAGLRVDSCAALRPRLVPGRALLESDWPLARIWEVHQDDYRGTVTVEFGLGPYRVLIHRPRWRVEVSPLSAGDYRFLDGACRGEPLGELLEAAVLIDPAFDPSVVLARWVSLGVLTL
jgi:hypothetical protein